MILAKAIEILTLIHDTPPSGANPDFIDAIQLGIEALKYYQKNRADFFFGKPLPLPGEDRPERPIPAFPPVAKPTGPDILVPPETL